MVILDESGALAIIAHAKNLRSAEIPLSDDPSRATRASGNGASNEVSEKSLSRPTAFPSESGHWYDPRTGKQVELPQRTWAKTAIAKGYVPGVTSITRVAHKEAIRRYDINRAIDFTALVVNDYPGGGPTNDMLHSEVWDKLNSDSEATIRRGKELHAAIELFAQGLNFDPKWNKHVNEVCGKLQDLGIVISCGNTENSFSTLRYGGKIDWHNDEWLLDFKTRKNLDEDTRWAVMRKGNSRATKVYDLKHEAEKAISGSNEYYIEPRHDLAWPEHAQQLSAYECGLALSAPVPQVRRCANVFVGVEDAKVVFHEWNQKDLLKGWRKFEALLNVWWSDYE